MVLPLLSRSTQIGIQKRFPVIEFEPLLDAIEAASLLRMHPKTLKKKARLLARLLCRTWIRDFGPEGVCRLVTRSLLGHGFGAEPAPGGSSLFCFD